MRSLRTLLFALSLASFMLLTGAAAQTNISVATGGTGGVYYPYGGGLAELINRYIEGYSAVAEVTGASVENAGLIAQGQSDIALALADTVYQAYTGTGEFAEMGDNVKGALAEIRALGSIYPNALQIVALADSGTTSMEDLRGKRVSVGAPGSGTELTAQAVLGALGITYDDIDEQRLNFNETADALRDGRIDAGIWSVGPPTSSILDLATSRDLAFIPLSQEELEAAQAADPVYAPYTLRAETYPGQAEDVLTISTPNVLIVNASMDEELAYQIVKNMFEHVDELIAIHPAANDTTVEFSMGATPIPLHPGALRYYQEIGAEVPERLMSEGQ